jgi:hypothetical protein
MKSIISDKVFETPAEIQRRTKLSFEEVISTINKGLSDGSVVGAQDDYSTQTSLPVFKLKTLFDY